MIDNNRVGERIKVCRSKLGLTLKAIEALAGVSATHISEIERGRTSPTIGALSKIADALEKPVSYFLEDEALEEFSHLHAADRHWEPAAWEGAELMRLTQRVPGSILSAHRLRLSSQAEASPSFSHEGTNVYYVREGSVEIVVEGESFHLNCGDSIHIRSQKTHYIGAPGDDGACLLQVSGNRHDPGKRPDGES